MKLSKLKLVIAGLLVTATLVFIGCSKDVKQKDTVSASISSTTVSSFTTADGNVINVCGYSQFEPLTAGQTIDAGSMEIANDENNIYVTYFTTGDWKIKELNLSVDCNLNGDCTQSKSSDLAPGKFPFKKYFTYGTDGPCGTNGLPNAYTFTIPKSSLGSCSCYCVYPHAVVVRCSNGTIAETQTAWGGSVNRITNGKWYGGTNYCIQQCSSGDGDLGK